jgi:hypothetical protein
MSTALVPVVECQLKRSSPSEGGRANADFLAHLVATKHQMPQTRLRRRAEPAEAIAAYGAADHAPTPSGHALCRSL